MTIPGRLRELLPSETAQVWEGLVEVVPREAYLVGGTGVAAHLAHRESRDFDFFLERPVDLDRLEVGLGRIGPVAVEAREEGTLNCVVGSTRVQFLDASDQRIVVTTSISSGSSGWPDDSWRKGWPSSSAGTGRASRIRPSGPSSGR